MDVTGKVAFVTGAASGIGLCFVKELLKNNVKGVLMADINLSTAERELKHLRQEFGNSKVFCVGVDVCDQKQLKEAFETAIKIFNQLDIVINSAGIFDEIQWEKCCNINLLGTIASTKLAVEKYLPQYKSADDAVVVNISSAAGINPLGDVPIYTATKFGVLGYVRAMGSEFRYRTNKIRVIGICPGKTATPMSNVLQLQIPEPFSTKFKEIYSSAANQPPENVAKHVVSLIRNVPSGSIWKIVDGKCEEVKFLKHEVI